MLIKIPEGRSWTDLAMMFCSVIGKAGGESRRAPALPVPLEEADEGGLVHDQPGAMAAGCSVGVPHHVALNAHPIDLPVQLEPRRQRLCGKLAGQPLRPLCLQLRIRQRRRTDRLLYCCGQSTGQGGRRYRVCSGVPSSHMSHCRSATRESSCGSQCAEDADGGCLCSGDWRRGQRFSMVVLWSAPLRGGSLAGVVHCK